MPSITFKLSDITYPKTAAKKNFEGFKNKEGYQVLAQGVSDVGDQLKEILVERQSAQNAIIKAEFDLKKKMSVDAFIKEQVDAVAKEGRPLTEDEVQKLASKFNERSAADLDPLIQQTGGAFQRDLLAQRDFSVKEGEIQVRFALRKVIDAQNDERVHTIIDPLIEAGDWEGLKKMLDAFEKNKTITPAYRAAIDGSAPLRQAELRANRALGATPGRLLEALRNGDERYAKLSGPSRITLEKKAEEATTADLTALGKSLSRAGAGLEDRAAAIEKARQRGSISDTQALALNNNDWMGFTTEYTRRTKKPPTFFTAQEQAEVRAGNTQVLEKFKDGGEIISRLIVAEKDDPGYKEMETQARLFLAVSGMPPAKVESVFTNIINTQKKNQDAMENSLSFQSRANRLADLTFRDAAPEARAKSVALYQEALMRFQEGLHDAQKGRKFLREEQIEEIFLAAMERVGIKPKNNKDKQDQTPKKEVVLNNQ